MLSLHDLLSRRARGIPVTKLLVTINLLVFVAMLVGGAGLWHSSNSVQLAWGANFGPATQDGEWWRLGTALFLHFGIIHLSLNLWALWDGGQLVERMYGPVRFTVIYFSSGLAGNLLSLVANKGLAISGGASGQFSAYMAPCWYSSGTSAITCILKISAGFSGERRVSQSPAFPRLCDHRH